MMVLSRQIGESVIIRIGKGKIVVKVLNLRGKNAKLGIKVFGKVTVHCEEVYNKMFVEPQDNKK